MQPKNPTIYASLNDWIAREAIPFAPDQPESLNAAIDRVVAALGDVEVLGFGETLHGSADMLSLRNRVFQRLVTAHGYTAIALESGFTRGHLVNDYVQGRGPASYDEVQAAGFSHDFGALEGNRALVEWMRAYNADPAHGVTISFYGFDSPTETMYADSPRRVLGRVLDYLGPAEAARRARIDALIGDDAAWEDPAVAMDPAQGVGLSPEAVALRLETEELLTDLHIRRPELVAATGAARYREAVHYAAMARLLLTYHAAMARPAEDRLNRLLGIRDAMMADNLAYIAANEPGKVLAFAHNAHLQRGLARMQMGPYACAWWPAGAHLDAMLGPRYAIIGTAVGTSEAQGIGTPDPDTLEARLIATPGPARLIPTHRGEGLPPEEIEALPTRSASTTNYSYFPLTPRSMRDFDWLATVDVVG